MVEFYTPNYVAGIINQFHSQVEPLLQEYFDSVGYAMVRKFKGQRVTEYVREVSRIVKQAIPKELDLGYVYAKWYTKDDDRIRIAIRGETDAIEHFEIAETFKAYNDEELICYFIISAYDRIMQNEYALANMEEASSRINALLKKAGNKYQVRFITSLAKHNLIKEITDECVTIYCDIDKAIDAGDTVFFSKSVNVMDKTERSKTNFLLACKIVEQLREIPTTPQFIGSNFPVYVFLTKMTARRDAHKEIAKVCTKNIADYGDKEYGIGYKETAHTYGIMEKDANGNHWVLSAYHKSSLDPVTMF